MVDDECCILIDDGQWTVYPIQSHYLNKRSFHDPQVHAIKTNL